MRKYEVSEMMFDRECERKEKQSVKSGDYASAKLFKDDRALLPEVKEERTISYIKHLCEQYAEVGNDCMKDFYLEMILDKAKMIKKIK